MASSSFNRSVKIAPKCLFASLPPSSPMSPLNHKCVTVIHLNNERQWRNGNRECRVAEEQRFSFCCRGSHTHTHLTHTSAVFQVCTVWPLKWVGVGRLHCYSVVKPKARVDKLSPFSRPLLSHLLSFFSFSLISNSFPHPPSSLCHFFTFFCHSLCCSLHHSVQILSLGSGCVWIPIREQVGHGAC